MFKTFILPFIWLFSPTMALNMNNKIELMKEIIPEVFVNHTATGILVTSPRIANPVMIPYDRCTECNAIDPDIKELYTKEGVTLWSGRLKPRFVPYDYIRDLPGHTFIKFKAKGRTFNIPHGTPKEENGENQSTAFKLPPMQPPPQPPQFPSLFTPPPPPPPSNDLVQEFHDSLSAATTFMDSSQERSKRAVGQEDQHTPVQSKPPLPERIPDYRENQENNFYDNALKGRCYKFRPTPEGIEREEDKELDSYNEEEWNKYFDDLIACSNARQKQIEKTEKFFKDLDELARKQ